MKMNCALCFKGRTHFLGDKTQLHLQKKRIKGGHRERRERETERELEAHLLAEVN